MIREFVDAGVLGSRETLQVLQRVVQFVLISMVDDSSAGDRAVCALPDEMGARLPCVRLGDLHKRAHVPVMMSAQPNIAHGKQRDDRRTARPPLARGRKTQPLPSLVPWILARPERCGVRAAPSRPFVAAHVRSVAPREARLGVPHAAAPLRTEPRLLGSVVLHVKSAATDLATQSDHAGTIGVAADIFTAIARERLEAESVGLSLRDARAGQLPLLGGI